MRTLSRSLCILVWMLATVLLICLTAPWARASKSLEGTVPQAASAMARQIDRQIAGRLMQADTPAQGVSLAVTVPVDLNNLDKSNPLARQMAEELARWFVQSGYQVQEVRKGRTLLIEPGNGEKLLTRRRGHLAEKRVNSAAILTGTYTMTGKNVRFNIRVLQTATSDVLGMATVSVPVTAEVKSLLGGKVGQTGAFRAIGPSVGTTLP